MRRRPLAYLPLFISGLCAVLLGQMAVHDPRYLVPFFAIAALMLVPPLLARRRMRRVLMSGDVKRVIGSWEGSLDRVMHPETMAPLMAAIAYAAHGWIEAARNALSRAVKGPAWDAALEQRLFVETLLDTFEGERAAAVEKARALEAMPMPQAAGYFVRKRITLLRRGLSALARAFAHEATDADERVLERAANATPLMHWAMRYAAAIVAVDHGKKAEVKDLLAGAPTWPEESAFRAYHEELLGKADGGAG